MIELGNIDLHEAALGSKLKLGVDVVAKEPAEHALHTADTLVQIDRLNEKRLAPAKSQKLLR